MNLDRGHTGLEAIPRLRQLNPKGVIVLITGFSELVERRDARVVREDHRSPDARDSFFRY